MPINKCTYCDYEVADDATSFYHEGAPYCNETCFDEAVVELAAGKDTTPADIATVLCARVGRYKGKSLSDEIHMVNAVIPLEAGETDFPGCIGYMLVFKTQIHAENHLCRLPTGNQYTISPIKDSSK